MAATKPAFNPPGKKGDIIFSVLVKLAALIVLLMLGGIIVSLIISSAEHSEIWSGFPVDQRVGCAERYLRGAGADLRTLVTSFIALLIAVPVSFGIALFLTELAGWLKRPLGIAIELLAAIPSIVYGMWGLFIFAPLFAVYFRAGRQYHVEYPDCRRAVLRPGLWYRYPRGRRDPRHHDYSVHCGGNARCVRTNPGDDERVGLRYWLHHREVIWRIVLPFTKNGVIGGIMLGLGRALGETMAVTFIIGNTYQLDSASLYMPGNSITSALANEFAEAESGLHVAALMELGLILFVITFIVLAASKFMIMRLAKNEGAR